MKFSELIFHEPPVVSESDYWLTLATRGKVLKPLPKPCKDCAVETGFYLEYAQKLAEQDAAIQKVASERWFCHNNCNRACAGIRQFLKVKMGNGVVTSITAVQ